MRTTTLLIAGFMCFNSLLAQTSGTDSLKNLLYKDLQLDTVRVNRLNNLAEQLRRSDNKNSDSLAMEALSLARRLGYRQGEGYALRNKGNYLFDQLNHEEALKYYNQSFEVFKRSNDKLGLANLLRSRARLYLNEGRYPESLDDNLEGIRMAEEAGDIKLVINLKNDAGYLYNMIGDDEKAVPYYTEALNESIKIGYNQGIASAYNSMGKTYKTQGKYSEALDAYRKGLAITDLPENVVIAYGNIGDVYERMGNYPEALININRFLSYFISKPKSENRISWGSWVLGRAFLHSGNADSGFYYGKLSHKLALQAHDGLYLREITQLIAESAANLRKYDTAYNYALLSARYKDSLTGEAMTRKTAMMQANFELNKKQAEIELQKEKNRKNSAFLVMVIGGLASAIVLAFILLRANRSKQKANLLLQRQKHEIDIKAGELAEQKDNLEQSYRNVELLSEIGRKITSSLTVEKIISTVYDHVNALMDASVFGIGIYNEEKKRIEFPSTYEKGEALPFYTNSVFDENRLAALCYKGGKEIIIGDLNLEYSRYFQQLPAQIAGERPKSLIYLPLRVKDRTLGVITTQSFKENTYTDYHLFMLRNIAIYAAIALENAESYEKLNETVVSLKNAQTQLIQSEKMASLGELTAGIAHEIQNPLNFVNNFSEINTELIDELKAEMQGGNTESAFGIAEAVRQNNEKINQHGKRADSIVKGMLQHSRKSSGKKEATDINELADEYLRLSYHGFRARDKDFSATCKTDFDTSIGKIDVIPQDMGRVLLNLINNAFYSVFEKKKMLGNDYAPSVTVSTKNVNGKIEMRVKDNGGGIPEKIRDKIFQPFFTTKPTGQGTGLGLSLSYDIITRGHGGDIKVETKEAEGTEFVISLKKG